MSDPPACSIPMSINQPAFPGFKYDTAISKPEPGVKHKNAAPLTRERFCNLQTNATWCEPKIIDRRFQLIDGCCRPDPLALHWREEPRPQPQGKIPQPLDGRWLVFRQPLVVELLPERFTCGEVPWEHLLDGPNENSLIVALQRRYPRARFRTGWIRWQGTTGTRGGSANRGRCKNGPRQRNSDCARKSHWLY
jgi:hypothetical protein